MARNLLPPSANPLDDSQSDQDDAESDEGDPVQLEKTASQAPAVDSGPDDDSGSSFPSPTASAFIVKLNPKSKKKKKKRDATAAVETHESEVKKKQKKNGIGAIAAEEDKAKKSSGRLWSPEDELIILQKMLDYKQETGVDASSNMEAFHSYIKDSLNAVADKSQLSSKIKKLKGKYQANALKEENGEGLLSLKGHEAKAYEYSKKIWEHKVIARGSEAAKIKPKTVNVVPSSSMAETDTVLALPVPEPEVSSKVVNVGGNAKVSSRVPKVARKIDLDDADHEKKDSSGGDAKISNRVPKVARKMDLDDSDHEKKESNISMPLLLDSYVLEKGLDLVERSKLDALSEKWTKYQLDEAELYMRRLDLVLEQTRLILDAQKSYP